MTEFSTVDIVLAATLKTKGYKLVEILKNGNKGTFIFDNVNETDLRDYDLGHALVEPRSLSYEIKSLTTAARR